jgi:hypothetical protein
MSSKNLKPEEREIIAECLAACVRGPFFDSREEFHTLFGLWPEEVEEITEEWPADNEENGRVHRAVNNALNNLLNYPHGCTGDTWSQHISAPPQKVEQIFQKWKKKKAV